MIFYKKYIYLLVYMHRISTERSPRKLTLVTSGMRNREAEYRGGREIFLLCPLESFTFGNTGM